MRWTQKWTKRNYAVPCKQFAPKSWKKQGFHMIKDLISESVIELFMEIFEEYKFDKGLSIMKMLKKN